jgi:hypothetical protein
MIIQPGLTQIITDVLVPAGQYISVGNVGNDATIVSLEPTAPVSYEYYTQIASLSNSAQTFGPYPVDRTVRITSGLQSIAQYDVGAQPTLRDFPPLTIGSVEPVGLVEPAATFITLTYNNNAGNVRLVSAGAHGLTAAIAVGASVYVTWATGAGVNGLYEVTALDADTTGVAITIDLPYVLGLGTPTVAVADTEVTIASVTVPGWSMGVGGEVDIDALFTLTNNATVKTLGMTYGGAVVLAASAANNASASVQKQLYNRGGSQVIGNSTTAIGHGLSTGAIALLNVDATQNQTFAITAKPATANNLVRLETFKLHIVFS